MKKIQIFFWLLLAVVIWAGCAKDIPSPADKYRIVQAHNAVDAMASAALLSSDPVQGFQDILPEVSATPGVESATIEGLTLYVTYRNGGSESWNHQPERFSPPYIAMTKRDTVFNISDAMDNSDITERVIPGIVGNNRVCLINQVYNDEKWFEERAITTTLKNEFEAVGFSVDVYDGHDADISFFQEKINTYGTIFFNTHGSLDPSGVTWVATGQEMNDFVDEIMGVYYEYWMAGEISIATIEERRGGQDVLLKYFKISSKFFEKQFSSDAFPNSLFYLVACQGLKSNDLWKALNNKGCQSIVGWTETNAKGAPVGKEFYRLMLSGKNVGEAFASITPESLTDGNAKLEYYPKPDGALATLFDDASENLPIEITSVSNNQVITNRVVRIAGRIKNAQSLSSAILLVNGSAVNLQYDGSFYFDQNIDLNAGNNTVKVSATGTHINGNPASGTTSINLIGNFPQLELWTKLRWNTGLTDVDFHLLPPGATYDDLFTDKDCYYSNQSTYWNGYLDVDDVDGWGPEHITIPTTPAPGIYTLVVHYFARNGGVNPAAFVTVETKNANWNSGNMPLVSTWGEELAGDAYAVCQIEFPSGNILPIQQKIVTPRSGNWPVSQKSKKNEKVEIR